MKTSQEIIDNAVKDGIITEQQISLLKARKNRGEKFNESGLWDNEIKVTEEQSAKGFKWLMGLWKTKTGKERKHNPFGYREQAILENFSHFELRGFYDAGNCYHSYFVPLYQVVGDNTSMEYYFAGGGIMIIG